MFATLKRFFLAVLPWAVLCGVLASVYFWWQQRDAATMAEYTVYLILPEGQDPAAPAVTIWLDAAREEGIQMRTIGDSDFLNRPEASDRRSAAILPDTLHRKISPAMVARLEQFAAQGGQLMVVYDGGIEMDGGLLAQAVSPLSRLVGVRYHLDREQFGAGGVERGPLLITEAGARLLQLPPGKTMPMPAPAAEELLHGQTRTITNYEYGALVYPILPTSGAYAGQALFASQSGGVAAGYRRTGEGGVLFVNTPIGYLKGQTDGLLLHAFLRHLVFDRFGLPVLKAAPAGIGGLIFNWHVDSNVDTFWFPELESLGILEQGPYSVHFTAGPDMAEFGDGLGVDLERNAASREWFFRLRTHGDALGNHGGWIHNYFGFNVDDPDRREQMDKFLELNEKTVSTLDGQPSREYSAPVGNQPEWVTDWLESHGFVAYYFTGNGGMSPTRSYREGRLRNKHIWSFPILTLGSGASFEEFEEEGLAETQVTNWLIAIADFCADTGTLRTFYSHIHGFPLYTEAVRTMLDRTRELIAEGRFRWITMSSAADFLNRREQALWFYAGAGDRLVLKASHPTDLADLAWEVPKSGDQPPTVTLGEGRVEDIGRAWRVVAGHGRQFEFQFTRKTLS